jgi:Flp pilus assembly protein TadG
MWLRQKSRRGAATVEFAIVAPIFFFTIIIPLVEFSRAMTVASCLAAAAQVGCRAAALPRSNNSIVQDAVTNSLASAGVKNANAVVVKVNNGDADVNSALQGDAVTVTVSVPYTSVSWLPISLSRYMGNVTLSSTQVMRHE